MLQMQMFNGGASPSQVGARGLDQFFTPEWAAYSIVRERFRDLTSADAVVDAGSGRGAWLKAIPREVPACGVEIDPMLAEFAADATGREVLVGDFRTTTLPFQPNVILGNPPFSRSVAEGFLARAAELLPEDGRVGFILPASFLSFSSTLARWQEIFGIRHDCLPRDLFPRIGVPLSFFVFTRSRIRRLYGFMLFDQALAVGGAPKNIRLALTHGGRQKGVWRVAVEEALRTLGGQATLPQIYGYMQGRLPKTIRFWQESVRRVLQEGNFVSVDRGVWRMAPA
jgi:hypothetical protein